MTCRALPREFRESYPDVSVIVRLEDAPLALKVVEEGNTDLAIVVEDRLPKSLKAHELFSGSASIRRIATSFLG